MEGDKKLFSTQDADAGPQNIRPLHGRTSGPTRRSTKGQWTAEEDEILCKAVQRYKGKNWKKIAECFKDRTDVQCLHRWQKVLNPELVKGPWSKEEDDIIIELVNKHGPKKWSTIAQHLPGRIGKQCRERWHNHLNPSINKEAWTQEEELALIRAHQIYGNKWAELTKFLPGRSDNSIKNHWNSSVKKKLDSYMASGLLEQFQGLRSSSLKMAQRSGDGSVGGHNGGNEGEEISECSQSSSAIGCSRTTSDMTDTVIHAGDDFLLTEESGQGKEESSSPASSPPQYHTSIEDVHVHIPEMPCDQNSSQIAGPSADGNFQFDLHEFPDISLLGLGREISPPVHCSSAIRDHEVLPAPSEGSERLNISASVDNMASGPIKSERLFIVNGGCYGVVLPERVNDECKLSRNHPTVSSMPNMGGGCPHPLIGQSSDYQILEPNQSHSLETLEQVPVRNFSEGFICTDEFVNSPSEKVPDEPPKLVAVDSFNSRPSDLFQSSSPSVKESIVPKTEQQDAGTLFYEPPRFPSLDVPFFSCDLIQPGNDLQQEYSPLGIRQIMMSSMSCLTPFRLWDSPSRDDSPDAVLKCAAKTFNCTPSILKKRHRDLLSPLSERKCDKKLESDRNRGSFSSLARDFSRLDVMLGEDGNFPSSNQKRSSEPSVGDKENIYNSCQGEREGKGGGSSALSDARLSETISDRNSSDNAEKGTQAHVTTTAGERVEKPAEVLVEHNTNDIAFFSPDRVGYRAEHYQLIPHGNSSLPFAISPTVSGKKHDNLASSISMKSASSSTPLQTVVDNSKRDIGLENFSMFGGTPFKRSLESPSAWKSPWFINSFIPGPRVDTEITIEDIGYFMSPGENTYDALGLMKQLSAQTAAAYADAQEVLGNDTPDTIFKERLDDHNAENGGHDQEDRPPVKGSQFSSDVLMERRILDFSECGTPVRSKANFKSPTVIRSSSSPSSYLLKSCR